VTLLQIAGCSNDRDGAGAQAPTATPGTVGAQVQIGNTISYGSFRTSNDIDCASGKDLDIGGSNNTLTIRGVCSTVTIGGASNTVAIAQVDKAITILGTDNSLTYHAGDPKIDNIGADNTVAKG